ncbi:MAG: hypothetical protein ACI4UJ_09250 [Candidatus Cryptobacteroides sp.]
MKALLYCVSVLGLFVSCNGINPIDDTGISPVSASEDVEFFFESYLPSYSFSDIGFNFGDETECFVINDAVYFKAVAPESVTLPEIDFEKYTLIVGQVVMGNPGYSFVSQSIHKGTLKVVYKSLGGSSPATMTHFYFWGLYDKLPEAVNIDVCIM